MFTHPKRTTRTILVCFALIFAVLLFAQTSKRLLKPVVAAPTIAAPSNSPASFANSNIASSLMTTLGSVRHATVWGSSQFPIGRRGQFSRSGRLQS